MIFVDQAKIYIKSGRGGDGCVSFRREKYVPNGGPDGGDGGRGGDIIFEVDRQMNTLYNFRHKKHYKATSGQPGSSNRCHGKDGEDLVIKVPKGTLIKDFESKKIICDMSRDDDRLILLNGGRGGKGNQHYATPTMQIPKYAQPGQEAKERWVELELKSIADVGLVGFPNVGKSTFLSRVSNAKPKIANYHFTTLTPNLGVVDVHGRQFVIADIPGLVEGAAEGIGLGHEFLKHVDRNKVLLHIVDAASTEGRDPVEDIRMIMKELEAYNPALLNKPYVIAANKMDAAYDKTDLERLVSEFETGTVKVFPISGVTGQGLKELLNHLAGILAELPEETIIYEPEFIVDETFDKDEPILVFADEDEEGVYRVEGSRVERMLGYTNLEDEKGFKFFQDFLVREGIIQQLEELGIEEGDTVKLYYLEFDYYK